MITFHLLIEQLINNLKPVCMWFKSHQICLTLRLYELQPTRLLGPWYSPGKNTEVGCHALLQGIILIQGWNLHLLCLLHWQEGSFPLVPPGKPLSLYRWAGFTFQKHSCSLSLKVYLCFNKLCFELKPEVVVCKFLLLLQGPTLLARTRSWLPLLKLSVWHIAW